MNSDRYPGFDRQSERHTYNELGSLFGPDSSLKRPDVSHPTPPVKVEQLLKLLDDPDLHREAAKLFGRSRLTRKIRFTPLLILRDPTHRF
ncbi:hypothetical protein [Phyllobacterium sp. CL33Tsu]|uniref:hypothetical protein n=1 Tax=Phyllobacterium sp. CL33Tsu TaxID=1798191 RepID=UPI001113D351|nr:hypothetical protein [Phyllobacterium sp. CL33Tsu]